MNKARRTYASPVAVNYVHPDRYSYRLQLRRVDPDRPDRGAR